MKKILTISLLLLAAAAHADDDTPAPHRHFSVMFQPMSKETQVQEVIWQSMNVVDALQSIQIAKQPACYEEVGTPRLLGSGPHPSEGATVGYAGLFAVGHYAISRLLENLVEDSDGDYRLLQRIWEYSTIFAKGMTISNNARLGLGLTHARGC